MEIWHGLEHVPADLGSTVVTIGVFDGIHKGHQQLIQAAAADATKRGLPLVLMTFAPHPIAFFAPDKAPAALTTYERRAELAAELGVDYFLIVTFDRGFSSIEPQDFVTDIVGGTLHAESVFVGQNFSYGAKAAGTTETLPAHCEAVGISANIVSLLSVDGDRVSSTRIRARLHDGDVKAAAHYLGRPLSIEGEVVHGQGRGGAQLGFPTANIAYSEGLAVPADGVYAAWFTATAGPGRNVEDADGDIEFGVRYPAAVSVGTNVTFGDTERTVEAFIIGRSADLYGVHGKLDFVDRIRGMVKFDGIEPLIEQMNRDVDDTLRLCGLAPASPSD